MSLIHLTADNFKAEVIESAMPVMVDFYADWCGPCKMIAPYVEQVAKEMSGKAKVGKLNVDDARDIAAEYGILSIPTILIFKNGKVAGKIIGAVPKSALEDEINKHL